MANRNYTPLTIKTLFGQASVCAYPDCQEPLIFEDRGVKTVVAEIAHIRAEKAAGPRHDPTYAGDIDEPANLLLMCCKHHKPIDDHHSLYSVEELEAWKQDQVATAGIGTPITDAEAKRFAGLTPEERSAVINLAKLTSRVESACRRVREALSPIEVARQVSINQSERALGPVYAVADDGTETLMTNHLQLSVAEEREWTGQLTAAVQSVLPAVNDAVDALAEEVAVLRMMSPILGPPAVVVLLTAQGAAQHARFEDALNTSLNAMLGALRDLWSAAD